MGCLRINHAHCAEPEMFIVKNTLTSKESENKERSEYLYGFNGKERDGNGEFGSTVYDYGFRIYNPSIAKFLSVDPLTKSYPMLTPYQFASNTPIAAIDLDGLEAVISITGTYWKNEITKAVNSGDTERATYLAFKAISTTLDDIGQDSKDYAARDWKGNSPASQSWDKSNPQGLTVVFDGETEAVFRIAQAEEKQSWYSGTFIEDMMNFLEFEGGGYTFYTSKKEGVGTPIGHVRKGKSYGAIDIGPLMDAIGASREAALSGPPNLESVIDVIDLMMDSKEMVENVGEALESQDKVGKVDSTYCETCERKVPTADTSKHIVKKKK
jgi:RHS repeat-associated protein